MNQVKVFNKIFAGSVLLVFLACSDSEYTALVKRELASGVVHDSLLFDLKMGQSKEYFLQSCWKLNQKGILSEGPGSRTVKYNLPSAGQSSVKPGITLLFFGIFNEDKIMTGMDYQFYYDAWSIWNKELQSDKLLPVMMDTLQKWYPGNNFIKVPLNATNGAIYVKVDGNRRITVKPLDDTKIASAKIDDLRYVLDK